MATKIDTALLMLCSVIFAGCLNKENAAAHFHANEKAIEALAAYYRTNQGIDYIEFRSDGSLDLWILDKEHFDRASSPATFKYQLWSAPAKSPEVSKALEYAGVSEEVLLKMKELARRAGCISLQQPFWDSDPVEMEIGLARTGMSKWLFRKYEDTTDVAELVSQTSSTDDHGVMLKGKWTLVMAKPAFN